MTLKQIRERFEKNSREPWGIHLAYPSFIQSLEDIQKLLKVAEAASATLVTHDACCTHEPDVVCEECAKAELGLFEALKELEGE